MLDTQYRWCSLVWVGSFLLKLLSTLTGLHSQALNLMWTRVILTEKHGDAEQARDDGVARKGGHVGVATLADTDRVQHGGEDFFLGWRVRTGVSQRTRVDELLPRCRYRMPLRVAPAESRTE